MRLKRTCWTTVLFLGLAAFSTFGAARAKADCNQAVIVNVMVSPNYCGGLGGFETVDSPRGICVQSDGQLRIAMAAFLAGRSIKFQFKEGDGANACRNEGNNYTRTVKYITMF